MQASMIGFKLSASELLLVCPLDLLPATLKRLSMFVMRAKARLSDASADFSLYGLCGSALGAAASGAPVPWSKQDVEGATVVRLYPADATARALWVGPASAAAPPGALLDPQLWAWSEVRSGIASISQPLFEALVPQMLNYESVGGVSFKKAATRARKSSRAASFVALSSAALFWPAALAQCALAKRSSKPPSQTKPAAWSPRRPQFLPAWAMGLRPLFRSNSVPLTPAPCTLAVPAAPPSLSARCPTLCWPIFNSGRHAYSQPIRRPQTASLA